MTTKRQKQSNGRCKDNGSATAGAKTKGKGKGKGKSNGKSKSGGSSLLRMTTQKIWVKPAEELSEEPSDGLSDVMKNSSGAHVRVHPSEEDCLVGEPFQVQSTFNLP
jgi:hypothetical protein